MIREVDLVSYLPPFMAEFREIDIALKAEDPEFLLLWKAADKVLKNEFIETADEYGIERFERMLDILPLTEDSIESRRARVRTRWFNAIPYNLKAFITKLTALCGDSDFTIIKKYSTYKVEILTNLELFGQVEELEYIIEGMMPCNMIVNTKNNITCNANGFALVAGGICWAEIFFITNDEQIHRTVSGNAVIGGGAANTTTIVITDGYNERSVTNGEYAYGTGRVISELKK